MKKGIDSTNTEIKNEKNKSMTDSITVKYSPIIMGMLLGCISIIMGLIPNGIRQFTGLTVIGNQLGYLLGALIIAWLNYESWTKGFLLSSLMIMVASATYYAIVIIFYALGMHAESVTSNLMGLLIYSIIGIVVGVLAATAVWIARKAKSKILNHGIFVIAYLGLLGVIYFYNVRFVLSLYSISSFESELQVRQFVGSIFEVVVAVVIITIIFGIGLKQTLEDSQKLVR